VALPALINKSAVACDNWIRFRRLVDSILIVNQELAKSLVEVLMVARQKLTDIDSMNPINLTVPQY
jgi:hypothetical protein